jgi:hypothetical protein
MMVQFIGALIGQWNLGLLAMKNHHGKDSQPFKTIKKDLDKDSIYSAKGVFAAAAALTFLKSWCKLFKDNDLVNFRISEVSPTDASVAQFKKAVGVHADKVDDLIKIFKTSSLNWSHMADPNNQSAVGRSILKAALQTMHNIKTFMPHYMRSQQVVARHSELSIIMKTYAGGEKNPGSLVVWNGWWDGMNELQDNELMYRDDMPLSDQNILVKQANDLKDGYSSAIKTIHDIACSEFGITVEGPLECTLVSMAYKQK